MTDQRQRAIPPRPDSLFVYGSLRSEFDNPHARFLRENGELVGQATLRGSIFLVGRYPAYRSEPDGLVRGELWRLHDPESTLAALDAYEGPAYPRVVVDLETPRARSWVYIYAGEVRPERRIVSGDFLAR